MAIKQKTRDTLFRVGYTTKGVIYFLIGGFALATVGGAARGTNGPKEVIQWIGTNPFGQILLGAVAIGLLFYSLYRLYSGFNPPPGEDDKMDKVKHVAWVVSGISYGLLAFFTFKLLMGNGGSGGSGSKQSMVAWLLEQPWGQILVAIVGVIMAGTGFFQFYKGVTDKHMEPLKSGQLSEEKEEAFKQTGRIGLVARAVVFGIVAYFLFRAAWMNDPSQFKGVSESLSYIRTETMGAALLAIVGLGLLAYGSFMFVRARYERTT